MTGIVLAGGRSSRMGRDKSVLPWDNSDLMQTVVKKVSLVCDDIILVSNQMRNVPHTVRVVKDIIPNMGPLGGIHAGLINAKYPYAFVTACDMPFIAPEAIAYLQQQAGEEWDVVIPTCGDMFEPMFAIYRKTCLPAIEKLLNENRRKIIDFFPLVRLKGIDVSNFRQFDKDLTLFTNINTAEEYERALQGQ